tara:strand:+ start:183 stop:1112 length:930 start_codon:yes stop_codon:yes gene_type:complete
MKNLYVKIILFSFIFIIIAILLSNPTDQHRDAKKWNYIYNLDNNIDVLYMGSSHIFTSLSPNIIDPITNLESFNLGSNGQMIIQTYYNLYEVLKFRSPNLIVIDINAFLRKKDAPTLGYIYQNLSGMKNSKNKINSFLNTIDEKKYFEALILFIKENYNWKRMKKREDVTSQTKGFVSRKQKITIDDYNEQLSKRKTNNNFDLSELNENLFYLDEIISLCMKQNIDLLFFKSPTLLKIDLNTSLNEYFISKSESKNIHYLNLGLFFEELNLNYLDYCDKAHLSITGSEKISKFFSNYLISYKNNYLLKD